MWPFEKKKTISPENQEAINEIDRISKYFDEQRKHQIESDILHRLKELEDNAFSDRARIGVLENRLCLMENRMQALKEE